MSEQGIIEIDVGLTTRAKAEIDEYYEKIEQMKKDFQEITSQEGEVESKDSVGKLKKKTESESDKDAQLAKLDPEVQKFFTNPQAFIADQIQQKLEQQFEDVLESISAIAIAILAIKVGEKILEMMVQKGGPLNRDFRRVIEEEVDVGLSRELAKQKELGISQTILPQTQGWVPNNTNWTWNSLIHVNETRIARIGLDDRAFGVTVQ